MTSPYQDPGIYRVTAQEREAIAENPFVQSATVNLTSTANRDPQREAEILRLSEATGWTSELVRANEIEALNRSQFPNFEELEAPLTGFLAESPDNAALVKDDLNALNIISYKAGKQVNTPVNLSEAARALYESGSVQNKLSFLYYDKYINANPAHDEAIAKLESEVVRVEADGLFNNIVTATAEQAPLMLDIVAKGLIGAAKYGVAGGATGAAIAGPAGVLPGVGIGALYGSRLESAFHIYYLEAGSAANEFSQIKNEKGEKLSPEAVSLGAQAVGVLNASLELAGFSAIMEMFPSLKNLKKKAVKKAVSEFIKSPIARSILFAPKAAGAIGIETATEVAQELITVGVGEVIKETSGKEFEPEKFEEIAARVTEVGKKAALATIGFVGIGTTAKVSLAGSMRVMEETLKPGQAQTFYDSQIDLAESTEEAKTKTRSPEKMQEILEKSGQDTPSYLSGTEATQYYQQSEGAKNALDKLGISEQDIAEAATTGSDIQLNMAEVQAKLSFDEKVEFLKFVKQNPSSISLNISELITSEQELDFINGEVAKVTTALREVEFEKQRLLKETEKTVKSVGIKNPKLYSEAVVDLWSGFAERMADETSQTQAEMLRKIKVTNATFKDIADAEKHIAINELNNNIPLGVTKVYPDGYVVSLFEDANMSTMLHETGHVFLTEIETAINTNVASEALVRDADIIKEWLGTDPKVGITAAQQDKFAQGFERYLREGKAPSSKLKKAFNRFRAWLTAVYSTLRGSAIDVPVTPEVSEVFDRLLATDLEAETFVTDSGMIISDEEIKDLGASEEQARVWRAALNGATVTVRNEIKRKQTAALKANRKQWKENAEELVARKRVNIVVSDLTSSTKGLGLAESEKYLSKGQIEGLEASGVKFDEVGLSPEQVAHRFNYANPSEMFKELGRFSEEVELRNEINSNKAALGEAKGLPSLESELQNFYLKRQEKSPLSIEESERLEFEEEALRTKIRRIKSEISREVGKLRTSQDSRVNKEDWRKLSALVDYISSSKTGLDTETVVELYGNTVAAKLIAKNSRLLQTDGLSPNTAALEAGYQSAETMVNEIINTPSVQVQIANSVKEQETAYFKENISVEGEFLHWNEDLAKYLEITGKFLKEKSGLGTALSATDMKKYADAKFTNLKVRDASKPNKHLANMKRALREKDAALKRGDFETASRAADQAALNFAFARKAESVNQTIKKSQRDLKKLRQDKGKAEFEYWKSTINMGNRFRLTNVTLKADKIKNANDLLGKQSNLLTGVPQLPEFIADPTFSRDYRDLTVSDMEALQKSIGVMDFVGRKIVSDKTALADVSFTKMKSEMLESVKAVKSLLPKDAQSTLGKVRRVVDETLVSVDSIYNLCLRLDNFQNLGKKDNPGPWERHFYNSAIEADSRYLKIMDDIRISVSPHMNQLTESFRKKPGVLTEIETPIPEILSSNRRQWRFETVVMLALNMGNRGNIKAVKDGYKLKDSDLMEIFKVLTDEDWNSIQAIGGIIGSYKNDIFNVQEKLLNFRSQEVEADTFVTPSGKELKGWYFPLVVDTTLKEAPRGFDLKGTLDKVASNSEFETYNPQVSTKALIERKDFGANPVKLDLSVLSRHFDWIAKYISSAEIVGGLSEVLRDEELASAVNEKFGRAYFDNLNDAVLSMAGRKIEDLSWLDWAVSKTRAAIGSYYLVPSFTVPLKQPYSLFRFGHKYGKETLARGVYDLATKLFTDGYAPTVNMMYDLSPFMKERNQFMDISLKESINSQIKFETMPRQILRQVQTMLFSVIKAFDTGAVLPAWLGAYNKGLKIHEGNQDKAVQYADISIRTTQPSPRPIDLSKVQRSQKGLQKALTFFSTFFFSQGSEHRTYLAAAKRREISTKTAFEYFMWTALVPPVAMNVMLAALHGDLPEPEGVIVDTLTYNMATQFVARELANPLGAYLKDSRYGKKWETPLALPFELATNSIAAITQDMEDDDKWKNVVVSFIDMSSFFLRVPVVPFSKKVIKSMEQIEQGERFPLDILAPIPE